MFQIVKQSAWYRKKNPDNTLSNDYQFSEEVVATVDNVHWALTAASALTRDYMRSPDVYFDINFAVKEIV